MKNATLKIRDYELDYDGVRHYLITHSFIGWLVAERLRKKYKIPSNNTSEMWTKRLLTDHLDLFLKMFPNQNLDLGLFWIGKNVVERQLLSEIKNLSKALKLDEKLLRIFVIYGNVPYKINGPKLIFHASPLDPITEPGTYMRIDERTTINDVKTELAKEKKWLQIDYQVMSKFQEHVSNPDLVKTRRKQIEQADELAVKNYLAIETEIIKLFKEKASTNNLLTDAGYVGELVKPALERVAGDSINSDLSDVEFDKQLNLRIKELQNNYYAITRRYSLPSQKDKNRIFGLMSL